MKKLWSRRIIETVLPESTFRANLQWIIVGIDFFLAFLVSFMFYHSIVAGIVVFLAMHLSLKSTGGWFTGLRTYIQYRKDTEEIRRQERINKATQKVLKKAGKSTGIDLTF